MIESTVVKIQRSLFTYKGKPLVRIHNQTYTIDTECKLTREHEKLLQEKDHTYAAAMYDHSTKRFLVFRAMTKTFDW